MKKIKTDLVRFMALPGDEQLDFLEKIVEAVAQAQHEEGSEKTTDRSEAQRLLEEAKE
jgi:hypothetical protein